jgi:hypothetical protein
MADPIPFPDASRQLAMRGGFPDLLYGTLFQPLKTFRGIAAAPHPGNRPLFYALVSVLLISGLAPVVQMAQIGGNPADLILSIPISAFGGLLAWLGMAVLAALAAYAFTGKARLRTFLLLSGLALLPGLLLGPVNLLGTGPEPVALLLRALPTLLVWLWSSLLFALAVMATYEMTIDRVFIVLCLPVFVLLAGVGGLIGFVGMLLQLRSG